MSEYTLMRSPSPWLVVAHGLLVASILWNCERAHGADTAGQAAAEDRNPVALALRDERVLVANERAGTVSLVHLPDGRTWESPSLGEGVESVAWIDATSAVVSVRERHEVVVLAIEPEQAPRPIRRVAVPLQPRGVDVAVRDGRPLVYVACWREDCAVELDPATGEILRRFPVTGLPHFVRVAPNGEWLVTTSHSPAAVTVTSLPTGEQLSYRRIFDGAFNLGTPYITADSGMVIFAHGVNRGFPVTPQMIEIGWVIDNRVTRMPLPNGEPGDQKQLGLDIRKAAVGDAFGSVVSSSGKWLAISCGGTHELLRLRYADLPWPSGDPGDFLPAELAEDPERFQRVRIGGRPQEVLALPEDRVLVVNALRDSLQVVDLTTMTMVREIGLHGAAGNAEMAARRHGEATFYDADRSLSSWYSCHTCHPDGHTNGQSFDTRNDGRYGSSKLTPSLRGVTATGPWTWHGWQEDLHHAMKTSLRDTLETRFPITDSDASAMVAFLGTLQPREPLAPPADESAQATWELGRDLFAGKAACIECHAPPMYTKSEVLTVGLEQATDKYPGFNPPSLRELHERRRWLHDGRAKTLESLLERHHNPENLGGEALSADERAALIVYLKSL